jgi:hypothetical protein
VFTEMPVPGAWRLGTFAVLDRDKIDSRELYLLLEEARFALERRRYTDTTHRCARMLLTM